MRLKFLFRAGAGSIALRGSRVLCVSFFLPWRRPRGGIPCSSRVRRLVRKVAKGPGLTLASPIILQFPSLTRAGILRFYLGVSVIRPVRQTGRSCHRRSDDIALVVDAIDDGP